MMRFAVLALLFACRSDPAPTAAPIAPALVAPPTQAEVLDAAPLPAGLVDVAQVIPDAVIDLRYTRPDNFSGVAVYSPGARCLLRPEVAQRLARAAERLRAQELRLVLWDCYRPHSVQKLFWSRVPDPNYVTEPTETTGSIHTRAAAVDVSLADAAGRVLAMPTAHDDFSVRAHRDQPSPDPEIRARMDALDRAMTDAGFVGLPTEWWHYAAPDAEQFPLLDEPL